MIDQSSIDLLALAAQYVTLKKASTTGGGEFAGPCPLCGGTDRFRVWPQRAGGARWWCRRCDQRGDAIDLVRAVEGVDFIEACKLLGLEGQVSPRPIGPGGARPPGPPPLPRLIDRHWAALDDPDWQAGALRFVGACMTQLDRHGARVWSYLAGRGLSEAMIRLACLGYNPQPYRGRWGETDIYLPAGVVIPWIAMDEMIWKVRIRTRSNEPNQKYAQAKGSANGLYSAWPLRPGDNVLLCEGEFDALSARTLLGARVTPLATGGYSQARLAEHVVTISGARALWLAFDDDEAGDQAAHWWQGVFPDAIRRAPTRHDVNDMVCAGDDLAAWLAGEATKK